MKSYVGGFVINGKEWGTRVESACSIRGSAVSHVDTTRLAANQTIN
jgi:hypothetical protein